MLRLLHTQDMEMEIQPQICAELNAKWKEKLKATDRNPIPLAPIEYREYITSLPRESEEYQQLLKRYAHENKHYGKKASAFVKYELRETALALGVLRLRQSFFNVMSIGLARDLDWIKEANEEYAMLGTIYEACDYAIANGEKKLKRMKVFNHNNIEQKEIQGCDEINNNAMLTFASGFIQILIPTIMPRVMAMLGSALKRKGSKLLIIHPFSEENPEVRWGDTVMYSERELSRYLEEGLNGSVEVRRYDTIKYWHHRYGCRIFQASL